MKSIKFLISAIVVSLFFYSCEDLSDTLTSAEITQKLEGSWQCDETSTIFKSTEDIYSIYISPSETDSTRIFISNFYQLGNNVEAEASVSGYTITIPKKIIAGDYEVRGSGTISSNLKEISWTYFVDDGSGQEDEVEAVYTFQY
jgi:hypothetical protein